MSPHRPALVLVSALVCVGLSASPGLASPGPAGDGSAASRVKAGEQCFAIPALYIGSVLVYPGGRVCILTP